MYTVLHRRSNVIASFDEYLKFQEKKVTFTHAIWVNGGNAKGKNENQEARKFEKYIHRVLNETGNITAFFVEHLNFPE